MHTIFISTGRNQVFIYEKLSLQIIRLFIQEQTIFDGVMTTWAWPFIAENVHLTVTDFKTEWETTIGTISEETPWTVIVAWFFVASVTIDVNRCWLTAVHLFHSPRRAYSLPLGSFSDCKGETYQRHIDELWHWMDETFRGLVSLKVDTILNYHMTKSLLIELQSLKDKLYNLVS
jgi:hypothetical protein